MTRAVVTVRPATLLKDAARLLVERGVSGLPVVDAAGHVLGVLSEANVVARERPAAGARFGGLLGWLTQGDPDAVRRRLRAVTVGEAMSTPAVTIGAREPAAKAAALVVEHGVNRLPVVDDEARLVGIVTRADLVRAFARTDGELEREIREDVLGRALSIPAADVAVTVRQGVVTLGGRVETEALADLLVTLTRDVLGVVEVRSRLGWVRERRVAGGATPLFLGGFPRRNA